jgi:hypothetical protein
MEQDRPQPETIYELYKLLKLHKYERNPAWNDICEQVEGWNWAVNYYPNFEGSIEFDLWSEIDCVPYTIANQVVGEGKKRSYGSAMYGHVKLLVEPYIGRNQVRLEWQVEDDVSFEARTIPKEYLPVIFESVIDMVIEYLRRGVALTNIKFIVCGGSYHVMDSKGYGYQIAAIEAFRSALDTSKLVHSCP